ncbi:hypothetical protein SESBI_22819 [Sesbania bispinosa]|nr:hypothetical protein SESBI_22819 [Sesbania bispinosa]
MDEGLPHGTGDQGLDEEVIISNPAADLSERTQRVLGGDSMPPHVANNGTQHHHQQERPSVTTIQFFPPTAATAAGGELVQAPNPGQPRPLNIPPSALHHPEPHFPMGNVDVLPHYGGIFLFTPPTAQSIVTTLGLPTSNLLAPLHRASSSSFQLTPMIYPRNPLGTETYAPVPSFPMTLRVNNPNLQQLNSQLSSCNLGATLDQMMRPRGFSGFFPAPRASHDMMAFYPIRDPDVMRDPSSRNIRMRMTLPSNNEQSLELQLSTLPDPSAQGSTGNPNPPIR